MIEFTYRIKDPNGMHARPAGKLATYAKQFQSEIRVKTAEKEADAKRLLALMSLGAKANEELTFTVTGADEQDAADRIREYLENACGEQA